MNSGCLFHWRAPSARRLIASNTFLALLVLLPGRPARSQTATAGAARLQSIEVTGSKRFRSDQISAATGLHAGAMITREDMQKAADRLEQLGPFATVQYRYSTLDAGLRIDYQVTDAPALPVVFDNFPWFTDEELGAALGSAVVLFDGTAPEGGTILDQMSAALEGLIGTRGVHVAVSHALGVAPVAGERILLFRVNGAELNIGRIEFSDALAQSDRGIQQSLSDLVGKPFSRSAIEVFEFEQVRSVYLSHAFLEVRFGRPNARFSGNPAGPLPNQMVVLALIEPGPAFTWNGATWSGGPAIPPADLDKLVGLKPRDPADGMKIEAMWQAARDAYTRIGYLDVNLNPVAQFDDSAKRVTYAVSITQGPQYRMGNLVLTGLSVEGERRIRAAWKIASGSAFDKSFYDEFLATGIQQAFAGLPVHYEKIGRFLQKDPNTGKIDVLLDFQ